MKGSGQWIVISGQWKSWALAKSKTVAESFRRSPAWEPASRIGWNFYEITVSVLPYILGAQMLMDIFLKKWGWVCFAAIVSVLLAVASFMLHRIRRLRIDLEVKFREMLEAEIQNLRKENSKLKNRESVAKDIDALFSKENWGSSN